MHLGRGPAGVLPDGARHTPGRTYGRYSTIHATGDTGGIDVGTKLTPYVRHRGHEHFIRGKATVIVQQDGTFTWSRLIRKNRSITAYVTYHDIHSNADYWQRVR